jgi:hypothetical protein
MKGIESKTVFSSGGGEGGGGGGRISYPFQQLNLIVWPIEKINIPTIADKEG